MDLRDARAILEGLKTYRDVFNAAVRLASSGTDAPESVVKRLEETIHHLLSLRSEAYQMYKEAFPKSSLPKEIEW